MFAQLLIKLITQSTLSRYSVNLGLTYSNIFQKFNLDLNLVLFQKKFMYSFLAILLKIKTNIYIFFFSF